MKHMIVNRQVMKGVRASCLACALALLPWVGIAHGADAPSEAASPPVKNETAEVFSQGKVIINGKEIPLSGENSGHFSISVTTSSEGDTKLNINGKEVDIASEKEKKANTETDSWTKLQERLAEIKSKNLEEILQMILDQSDVLAEKLQKQDWEKYSKQADEQIQKFKKQLEEKFKESGLYEKLPPLSEGYEDLFQNFMSKEMKKEKQAPKAVKSAKLPKQIRIETDSEGVTVTETIKTPGVRPLSPERFAQEFEKIQKRVQKGELTGQEAFEILQSMKEPTLSIEKKQTRFPLGKAIDILVNPDGTIQLDY